MHWFYGEFLGLQPVGGPPLASEAVPVLRYRSERFELRIAVVDQPAVNPVPRRLTVEVPSLEQAAAILDERKYAYDWLQGLSFTDRAIVLLDPAEHRVMLRRSWGPITA